MFNARLAMELLDCEFAIRCAGSLEDYLKSLCKNMDELVATYDARQFLLGITDRQYQSYLVNEFRKNPKLTREELQAIPYTVNQKDLTEPEREMLQRIGINPDEDSWYKYWIIKSRKGNNHNFPWGSDLHPDYFGAIREWEMDYHKKLPSYTLAEAWHEAQESRKPPEQVLKDGSWSLMKYTTEYQLVHEGDTLEHCVGGGDYWDAMKKGEIEIYSLWRKNTPVATFEIKNGYILQCKGYGNEILSGTAGEMAIAFANQMGWIWKDDKPCDHTSWSYENDDTHTCDRCGTIGDHNFEEGECIDCGFRKECPDGEHELVPAKEGWAHYHECENCTYHSEHEYNDYDEDGEYCECGESQPHNMYSRPHGWETCECRNDCGYSPPHDWIADATGWTCDRCGKEYIQRPITYTSDPSNLSQSNYRNLMEDLSEYSFEKSPIEEYFPSEYIEPLLALSDFRFLGDFQERYHKHKYEYFAVRLTDTKTRKHVFEKVVPPSIQKPDLKLCLLCGESIATTPHERQDGDTQSRLPFMQEMPTQSGPQK